MRCAASHEYLIKMRMEGGLNGIKIGPQLGKGSYGRVFKGDPSRTPGSLPTAPCCCSAGRTLQGNPVLGQTETWLRQHSCPQHR